MEYEKHRDVLVYVQKHPGVGTKEVSEHAMGSYPKDRGLKTSPRQYLYSMAYQALHLLEKKNLVRQDRIDGRVSWVSTTTAECGDGVTRTVCRFLLTNPDSLLSQVTKALFDAGCSPSADRAPDLADTYSILKKLRGHGLVDNVYCAGTMGGLWYLVNFPLAETAKRLDLLIEGEYFVARDRLESVAEFNPPAMSSTTVDLTVAITQRRKRVIQYVRDNPGTTSSEVGKLYRLFFPEIAARDRKHRATTWALKLLSRLAKKGLVVKYKDNPHQDPWFWKLPEAGTATEGSKHDEVKNMLEGAVEISEVKETQRITEKKCTVRVPGLVGLAFFLWCDKNKRDPNTVAAELLHKFLASTEEYGAVIRTR